MIEVTLPEVAPGTPPSRTVVAVAFLDGNGSLIVTVGGVLYPAPVLKPTVVLKPITWKFCISDVAVA